MASEGDVIRTLGKELTGRAARGRLACGRPVVEIPSLLRGVVLNAQGRVDDPVVRGDVERGDSRSVLGFQRPVDLDLHGGDVRHGGGGGRVSFGLRGGTDELEPWLRWRECREGWCGNVGVGKT